MPVLDLLTNIRFQDVLDILFLTIVAYYLYLWFQGTKAIKVIVGLMLMGMAFALAKSWGLFLTTWMFQILWQVFVILLIILFQPEIRQVLERINPLQRFKATEGNGVNTWEDHLAEACFALARHRTGGLILIERQDRVRELITGGIPIQAEPNPDVLLTLFNKESPVHDGAVVIRSGQVTTAACYLPLSTADGLPQQWGTRHRAAYGIAERCDAWVLVISEERREITLIRGKNVHRVADREELSALLSELTAPPRPKETVVWKQVLAAFVSRWRLKLGTLLAVSLIWLLLAGQQNFDATYEIPVELLNLPEQMTIAEPANPVIKITVRGLRKDSSTINPKEMHVWLNLARVSPGEETFRIRPSQIFLPKESVDIVRIEPAEVTLTFQKKP